MKIIILSDANSIHTLKWARSLKQEEIELKIFSFFRPNSLSKKKYKEMDIEIVSPDLKRKIKALRKPNLGKIRYFNSIFLFRKMIKEFNPTLIHAHYASSYGVLALLSRFRPFVLSVWGSDVYHFPNQNIIYNQILKLVVRSSDKVCSTSMAMKEILLNRYKRKDVELIPFGVDVNDFKQLKKSSNEFTVGTIKSIEKHNGIDCLIDAADILVHTYKIDIRFIVVGTGTLKKQMEEKTNKKRLDKFINFQGYVDHQNVKKYYKRLSVFIAVSTSESFGVSILEAAAFGIPSITSNVGGLKEVNINNQTGLVIEPNQPKQLADAIVKLYKDKKLRMRLGDNARNRVVQKFNWNDNVKKMITLYNELL